MMHDNIQMLQQQEYINQFARSQVQQRAPGDTYGRPSSIEYQQEEDDEDEDDELTMSQQTAGEHELSHYDDDESEEQQPPQQFSSMQMSQVTQNNKQIAMKTP